MSGMSIIQQFLRKNQEDEYRKEDAARRDKELAAGRQHDFDKLFTTDALNEDAEKRQLGNTKETLKFQEELKSLYADKRAHEAATAATLKYYADKGIPPEQAASVYDSALKAHKAELQQNEQVATTNKDKSKFEQDVVAGTKSNKLKGLVSQSEAEADNAAFNLKEQTAPENQTQRKAAWAAGDLTKIGNASKLFTQEAAPNSFTVQPPWANPNMNAIAPSFTLTGQSSSKEPVMTNIGGQQIQTGERIKTTPASYNPTMKGKVGDLPPVTSQAPAQQTAPRINTLQAPPSSILGTNMEQNMMQQFQGREAMLQNLLQSSSPEAEMLRKQRILEEEAKKNSIRSLLSSPQGIRNY